MSTIQTRYMSVQLGPRRSCRGEGLRWSALCPQTAAAGAGRAPPVARTDHGHRGVAQRRRARGPQHAAPGTRATAAATAAEGTKGLAHSGLTAKCERPGCAVWVLNLVLAQRVRRHGAQHGAQRGGASSAPLRHRACEQRPYSKSESPRVGIRYVVSKRVRGSVPRRGRPDSFSASTRRIPRSPSWRICTGRNMLCS